MTTSDGQLTSKQEHFAQCVASGMTQADAYRTAYNVDKKTTPQSIAVNASKLMADANIRQRANILRKEAAEQAKITLVDHLSVLEQLRDAARDSNQINAAISAEVARGKASGLYVEKVDAQHSGSLEIQTITRKIVDSKNQ